MGIAGRARTALLSLLSLLALSAFATPACAQFTFGTNHTAFTAPSQTVSLTYKITNDGLVDAQISYAFTTAVGNPSCAATFVLAPSVTKSCTFSYQTTLTDVAAAKITVLSQWEFCEATGCVLPDINNHTLPIPFTGPPVITGTSMAVPYNSAGTPVDLTGNITGPVTSIAAAAPAHGTVTVSGKVVTYKPTAGYYGADSFTYTATNANGTSAPASISVTVATPPAPSVAGHAATIAYNSPGTPIDLTSKISGVATAIAVATAPTHGTATVSGNTVTYKPNTGYSGADGFTYTATGPGGTSAPATVSLTVLTPAAPTAAAHSATIAHNSPGTPIDLTSKVGGAVTSIAVATAPVSGTASVSGNVVTYKPNTGYAGADSFAYTATGPGGTSAPATVNLAVLSPAATAAAGTITVKVVATGGNGTFTFASNVAAAPSFQVTTSGGVGSTTLASVPAGSYTLAQSGGPGGFKLVSLQCTGATVTGTSASITLTALGSATCTFTNVFDARAVQDKTRETVRNFMNSRANAIVSGQPDAGRQHGRLSGSLFGDDEAEPASGPVSGPGAGSGPLASGPQRPTASHGAGAGSGRFAQQALAPQGNGINVAGNIEDGSGRMSVSTSLSQMRAARGEPDGPMGLGGSGGRSAPVGTTRPALFDIWMEAHVARFEDNTGGGKRKGGSEIVYLGADYLVHRAVLVGALVQFDWARESSSLLNASTEGRGWMAGPYLSAKLTKNVFFDARAAWGQSANTTSPFGDYKDSFSTNRALYMARLTGNWHQGALRITPSAELTYYQETQKEFQSVTGVAIPSQTLSLGRLTIGPEFGYRMPSADGSVFEPYVSLKALWDFQKDTTVSIGGMDVGSDALRGKAELGASYKTQSGIAIKGGVAYDGIGDKNYHAYEGKMSINVPLQ